MSAQPISPPVLPLPERPAPPAAPPPDRRLGAALLAVLVIVSGGGFWLHRVIARNSAAEQRAQVVRAARRVPVQRGSLEVRIRLQGTLRARVFATVVAPLLTTPERDRAMSLIRIKDSGTRVHKGEIVAEFDPQAARDHLDDTRDGLNERSSLLAKRSALLDIELAGILKSIDASRGKVEKARWDLKSIPVRSAIQSELFKLNLEQAEAEYQAALASLPLQLESQAAFESMYEITEHIEKLHVARHEKDIRRLTIHAPVDGMVVLGYKHRHDGVQATVGTGDQFYSGSPLLRVVDTSTLEVDGAINQSEAEQFRVGQPARIRLDGYSGAEYQGRVRSIGVLATAPGRSAFYNRTIPIQVELLNPDDRLLPDLTASAEVLIDKVDDVLLAPSDAISEESGHSYVYVLKGQETERRPVTTGRMSATHTVIEEGVNAGEVLVVSK
ncbi:MAG: efflux RND transporter periplasmic adaptor subunit [Acidobacteria bacterium]|nr:efflux RND transporter periplasmic adaptor subunit [Acidobacteriota bacterium]